MPDDAIYRTMLFDYYSEFLTEKQKLYYDLHYNEDLSLAEISEQEGVSKQAVWDNLKHAEAVLTGAEEKLSLVHKSFEMKQFMDRARQCLENISTPNENDERSMQEALRCIQCAEDLF